MNGTAKKMGHRDIQALAQPIPQCDFNRRLGDAVALHDLVDKLDRTVHIVAVAAKQRRGDIGVDCRLNAFRTLRTVAEPANRCAFTDPFGAIRELDLDQNRGLRPHRSHRQHVPANGRDVEDHGLDLVNLGHWASPRLQVSIGGRLPAQAGVCR